MVLGMVFVHKNYKNIYDGMMIKTGSNRYLHKYRNYIELVQPNLNLDLSSQSVSAPKTKYCFIKYFLKKASYHNTQ